MTMLSANVPSATDATPTTLDGQTASLSPDAAMIALALPVGILIVDADGRIVITNRRLCDMFGYTEAEICGQPVETLLPERWRKGHVGLRDGYHRSPEPRPMGKGRDLTGRRKDGREFPIEIGLGAIFTIEGRMTLATVVDITERKRSELQLREANAQLEEFSYVASHDLRSPLRGVSSLVDFIREDFGDTAPEGALRNLDRMKDRIGRMESLIEDLLTYARAGKRSVKLEMVDLAEMVDELEKLEPPPTGFQLERDLAAPPFVGAATPLRTVIRNLYSNAIKHHDREQGTIRIHGHEEGNYCVIEVADDGPGIAEAVQDRVFRLFQRLDAGERQGSGLGLAVAKRLVEGHGGRIELISSERARGATFRVFWPRFMRTDLDD